MPLYDLQGLTKLSLRQLNLSPVGQTANPLEPGYYAEIVNQGSLKNPGAGQYPAGYYQGVTIPGWITEASDTTAREWLAAAYDSSANLTYAIDGMNSALLTTVTAYSHASNAWTAEASDTTARDSLAAAYDSSANLTYAIDGYTSIEISLVTAYLSV